MYDRLQDSSQADREIDGTTLDTLGPLVPFLDRDSLALVDRKALALRLEEMQNFCLPKEALKDISSLLTQRDLLGWNGTAYFWLPRPSQLHEIFQHLGHTYDGMSLSGSRQIGTLGMWNIWAGWCFLSLPSRLTPSHWWDWAPHITLQQTMQRITFLCIFFSLCTFHRRCWIKTQWSRSWWVKVAGRTAWWAECVRHSVWTGNIRSSRLRASFEESSKLVAGEPKVQ